MSNKFVNQLKQLGVELSEAQEKQFFQYYELLVEWNKVMNLTGITECDEVYEKHFLDSLALVKAIDITKVNKVIDIGTGAGFPGIPLKIAFPHLEVVLLDSLNKRINFLNTIVDNLGLKDVETLHGRAEDYAKKEDYREKFDLCVSRAVANLSTLSEYCIPYIKVGGTFISYKSGTVEAEIDESQKAVKMLGGAIDEVVKLQLPDTDINRSFIKIVKKESTKKKYPRKAGLPAKEPLK